jgi:hypothetical protein
MAVSLLGSTPRNRLLQNETPYAGGGPTTLPVGLYADYSG